MISAAWDWYYGSQDEELLADCEFGEPFSTKHCSNKDVCVRPATLGSGMQVTVFTQVKTKPKEVTSLEMNSNRLKLLRHPNILRHIQCVVTETEVHLVTERVSPLHLQIQKADANEVTSGIYDIAQALKFLHEKAGLSHNTLNIETIFVTEGGAWKLSGLEYACPFSEATAEYLKSIKRPDDIVPPEEVRKKETFPIEKKFAHCRDVYALGVLLAKFNKQTRFASGVRTQEIEDLIDEVLQNDYKSRPPVTELLDTAVLASEYISIVNFLQSITLKSKPEKTRFFTTFIARLKKACVSDELIAKRITKLLLSPVTLSENEVVEMVVPRLLTPVPVRRQTPSDGLISSEMFARYVIPQIVDMLEIKLLHVRLVLVNNFHRYVHMFEKTVLEEIVLPEILLGFHDSNNQLVKASLHALADAIPIVGGDVIVGEDREKIFSFGMPKFNGSVLVDTSSLAYELKPKRKPKKPKKKKSPQKGPLTLLQLAMSRERTDPPKSKSQKQRDLMMLKQNELAVYLTNASSNGHTTNGPSDNIVAKESLHASTNGAEEIGASVPLNDVKPKSSANDSQIDTLRPPVLKPVNMVKEPPAAAPVQSSEQPIKVQEPEVETWAGSGSDDNIDNEHWGDFENFDVENGVAMATERKAIESVETLQKSLLPPVPKPTPTKSETTPLRTDHDLGNEFEIAVKVKPPPPDPEMNFFADMEPEISTKKIPVKPVAQTIPRRQRTSVSSSLTTGSGKSSPMSISFRAEDGEDETDGWENEAVAWNE